MKQILKAVGNLLSLLLVAPLGLPIRLLAPLDGRDQWFQFGSHAVAIVPGLPGDYVRRAYYRWVIGSGSVSIGFGTIFAQRDTELGEQAYIGMFCNIGSSSIGRDVLIGTQVMIASPTMHRFDRLDVPISQQGGEIRKIRIGDGAWLGNGAIVLNDVGDGAVVAAGAVVTKPCETNGIYGGNPAKLIRFRGETVGAAGPGSAESGND